MAASVGRSGDSIPSSPDVDTTVNVDPSNSKVSVPENDSTEDLMARTIGEYRKHCAIRKRHLILLIMMVTVFVVFWYPLFAVTVADVHFRIQVGQF